MTLNMVLTVGHSTHEFSYFLNLLRGSDVTAVADVRSIPVSRFVAQYNQRSLELGLYEAGIKYVFLGKELGARTEDTKCYVGGRVKYDLLAQTHGFMSGIERLTKGAEVEHVAIMCSEGEPLNCHRTVLIARILSDEGISVGHIHGNGRIESHASAMERLMAKFGLAEAELFRTPAERLEDALGRQEDQIAYVNEGADWTVEV